MSLKMNARDNNNILHKSKKVFVNIFTLTIYIFILSILVGTATSIKCYQCSSEDNKSKDTCGAYEPFDTEKNTAVDCMGEDAVNPGTFCYKSIQQGPRGFIWDGRWRTVIRRCAQISDRGNSWGCDWGYDDNGVYQEECHCAEDGCNGSTSVLSLITPLNFKMVIMHLSICYLSFRTMRILF